MNEWVVLVIRVMYRDTTATVRLNEREREAFSVKVICSQSTTVHHRLEALSREFGEGLPSVIFSYLPGGRDPNPPPPESQIPPRKTPKIQKTLKNASNLPPSLSRGFEIFDFKLFRV